MPHIDLLELPYFEGIGAEALVSFVDLMAPRSYASGTVIVAEGAPGEHPLCIATRGKLEITKRTPDGAECRLAELTAPTLFGEIELICGTPAVATVRATTDVQLFQLTRAQFEKLAEAHHPALWRFTLNVARVACHRLAIADTMLAGLVGREDLAEVRRRVFAELANQSWATTTGGFKRPKP